MAVSFSMLSCNMGKLRELLAQLSLFCKVQTAFADFIEDHEKRLKAAEDTIAKLTTQQTATHTRVVANEMAFGNHTRNHP